MTKSRAKSGQTAPAKIMRLSEDRLEATPLIFMPDFGGNVLYARGIVSVLSKEFAPLAIPLSAAVLDRLKQVTVNDIADALCDAIRANVSREPIHLIGYSFAGILAFETARKLEEKGVTVDHVWLIDTRSHRLSMMDAFRRAPFDEMHRLIKYLYRKFKLKLGLIESDGKLRSFRVAAINIARHPEAYQHIIRATHGALSKHRIRLWPNAPVSLFRSLETNPDVYRPDDLGWSKHTAGSVRVIEVEGDHESVVSAGVCIEKIAGEINASIANATAFPGED